MPGYSLSSLSKALLALLQGEADTTQVDVTPLIEQLDRAEKRILKLVQSGAFPKEMGALQKFQRADSKADRQFTKAKKYEIKKLSTLYCLDSFLDKDGLTCIVDRLGNSQEFTEDFKHPVIILLKKSFMVEVTVCDAHKKVANPCRGITLNELGSSLQTQL